ncbi:choice-of-anchor I family protein [Trichormus sp. NMC-1]|uniref:choice-of-anchor I family protein n=1 Tax=Trichormus sp. NMC-1 TaxID=1853259 RepID=UPI000B2B6528|nr:choice-of-anchor I family protein [Trichormus sp. NMC-1]
MALAAGNIAFVGFNADGNDDFAFVAIVDINAGESITFEDNEWDGSALNTGEGRFTWTATSLVTAGTIVSISSTSLNSKSASTGTLSTGTIVLGNNDESIYAYQGPAATPTFITAISSNAFSNATTGTLTNTGLTAGANALALSGSIDVAEYNGSRSGQANFVSYLSLINNPANWQTQDGSGNQSNDGTAPDVPFSSAAFAIGAGGTTPTVNLSVSSNIGTEVGTTVITVTATASSAVSGNQTVNLGVSGTGITASDYYLSNTTITIPNGQTAGSVSFIVADDAVVEATETAILTFSSPSAGISLGGTTSQNITITNNDSSFLTKVGGITSTNGAEIPAFDPGSDRLFVVAGNNVEFYTVSNTGSLAAAGSLTSGITPAAGTALIPNSVAVKNGVVAVAYAIKNTTTNAQETGKVAFFNAADGSFISAVDVGALPDMLTFTPDGTKVLVANEGEPNSYGQANSVDPEGSVSIIDISGGVASATVQTATFTSFNSQIASLKAAGVRIIGPGATVAQDVEPEYIAVDPDGLTARIILQENNAIAILNITTATITQILPLGRKDHSLPGNGIDASDQDGGINIQNWPVFGLYQPDAIANFTVNGQTYYITANEGDSRDYTGFSEEIRVSNASYVLDPNVFSNAAILKQNANLGRLQLTNATGDTNGDGYIDRIEAFGARSFSIWNASGTQVFDSGDQLEQITAARVPTLFNSDGQAANFDSRSDNKGPEPEGVVVGVINNRTYAFIGLERTGDVIVYDVTNPNQPQFVQYINTPEDVAPEGLTFISAADSPTGKPLLVIANEVSKTVAVFEVNPPVSIRDIQGAGHTSPLVGQNVNGVAGIVTTLANNGFYFQDPNPDNDDRTSEAIFVFTSSAPTVQVGDSITVSGTVTEFRPGGAGGTNNLTITEITSPSITVLSNGNSLPAAIVLGNGGRAIPTTVIDNDSNGQVGNGTFDPDQDGIDFYESLEGMRVQINNPVTVSPTNQFGEIWVLADDGVNATGRTARGGVGISQGDFNPERIQIDDTLTGGTSPNVSVGAELGTIVGVVNYSFGNYEILPSTAPNVVTPSTLTKEVTNLTPTANQLTIATFNVENLDPGDGATQFNNLANRIVNNLKSPDIITLEEIQDNNGPTNDSVVDASTTYQTLINAIAAAGGPTYQYRQINPVDDTNGGQPGGNIRVGFLFNPQRVSFVDIAGGTSTSNTTVTNANGVPTLSASPGLIDPTNAAFNASRKPLVGEFTFNGQTVYVIANHFNSKGGDQPLFGVNQPPVLTSETQRNQQATIVKNFVQSILAVNPNANIVVAGDLNDFEFSNPLTTLEGAGLNTLIETLPQNERYTYNFEGNAQSLDHILVSNNLLSKLDGFDVVHINSEFFDQDSDHDPSVARFTLNNLNIIQGTPGRDTLNGTPADDLIQGFNGNDRLFGRAGDDTLEGGEGNDILNGETGADTLIGGLGNDIYYVDNIGDVVTENADEGIDTVYSSVTFTLVNTERLYLTGTENIDGIGNSSDNQIVGNSGNNSLIGGNGNDRLFGRAGDDNLEGGEGNDILNGETGADTLIGGLGNDIYYVDNIGDVVTENADEGIDTVYSSVTFTLVNTERLYLTGTENIDGIGNSSDNQIVGNSGNNSLVGGDGNDNLYGGAGEDTLTGGLGNDNLYLGVDNAVDVVNYVFGDGVDKVYQFVRGASGDRLNFSDIAAIDVVTLGANTQLRVSDGIESDFGKGQLLVTLLGTSGFNNADVDVNLFGANFLFS